MNLSDYLPITGTYNFSLDDKLRLQIPSEVRERYWNLIHYEFTKDTGFNVRRIKNLTKKHKMSLYIWRNPDEKIIKVYFPFLSEEIKKHMEMGASNKRINFFKNMFARDMDSQYRVKLSDVTNQRELNELSGKSEKYEGSHPITIYGNLDHLLINLEEMKNAA
tara:strand:+ start:245 stop:733 length:489 start_codon:yes stop_codon:yes gene_type:complete